MKHLPCSGEGIPDISERGINYLSSYGSTEMTGICIIF